ncbi:MAG: pyridoxal phosphate-dependent aminotransferase [Oscillospiraceae bacterium]|nr:pyridoxal phosphate-dependent aminotransferase [Oscillospiraceae bacterium]
MKYDFDQIINRQHTNSVKYDFAKEHGKPIDALPLWVADMDFCVPHEVQDALIKTAQHGIFGYSEVKGDYFNALRNWYSDGFGFHIQPDWLVKTPGVVFAISTAIRAFTQPGDRVLIQPPVYPPFRSCILANDRRVVTNPLVLQDGKYQIDFADFERKIVDNDVKLFLFCSPHNPVGRVWSLEELQRMGEICVRHNCKILSDEIHCDFAYKPYKHRMLISAVPECAMQTVICTAPSKTFNLAGLQTSNLFIPNPDMKAAFQQELKRVGYGELNTMGLVACQSAYEYGRSWLNQLMDYLAGNFSFLKDFLAEHIPQIKLIQPEATYLAWLDCRGLGLSTDELNRLISDKAKLWLNDGSTFGAEGVGFQRMNLACPKSVLEQALHRLREAVL